MSGPYRTNDNVSVPSLSDDDWFLFSEEKKSFIDDEDYISIAKKTFRKEHNSRNIHRIEYHVEVQTSVLLSNERLLLEKKSFVLEESDLKLLLKHIKSFEGVDGK